MKNELKEEKRYTVTISKFTLEDDVVIKIEGEDTDIVVSGATATRLINSVGRTVEILAKNGIRES